MTIEHNTQKLKHSLKNINMQNCEEKSEEIEKEPLPLSYTNTTGKVRK